MKLAKMEQTLQQEARENKADFEEQIGVFLNDLEGKSSDYKEQLLHIMIDFYGSNAAILNESKELLEYQLERVIKEADER